MRKVGFLCGAAFVAFGLAFGCGGNGQTSGGDGGADAHASRGVEAGPLAACGDSCTAAQIAASCVATCDKIAHAGCSFGSGANCPMSCSDVPSMTPACMASADAFLRCIEAQEPTCDEAGTAQFVACDSAQQALTDCLDDAGPVSTSSGGSGGTVPSNVCPNIPRPSAGGVSGRSGSGGAGPNAPVTCTTSCQDGAGNVWQADCTGTTCTCTYNGGMACNCPMTASSGACTSCCPGTG
jgi:hypothetical protein